MIYSVRATGQTTEETRTEAHFNFCFVQEVGGMIREDQKKRKGGDGKGRHRRAGGRMGAGLVKSCWRVQLSNLPSIAVINYLRLGAV